MRLVSYAWLAMSDYVLFPETTRSCDAPVFYLQLPKDTYIKKK